MDRRRPRRPTEHGKGAASSPQPPLSTPSNLLCDVSNLETPNPCSKNPNPNPIITSSSPLFFTASKNTPYLSYSTPNSYTSHSTFRNRTSSVTAPVSRSKTVQRLKALELEQSRSARNKQVQRGKILESFARSLTAWLNFLLHSPKECGCKVGSCAVDGEALSSASKGKGKRESLDGGVVEIGRKWRSPKRQRVQPDAELDNSFSLMKPMALLKKSLCKVCSVEDMWERMMFQMSSKSCNEVLLMMTQVCKNIDEGRLKMKPHCPIVTDLAVRDKAIKVLLCYNPLWLKIGLHILFGGDSLLLNHGDQDEHLLKEFIEKHFFTHAGIARTHALNRLVGGLYRPGYYEALGVVILKRFFLLTIALDKAKSESSIPIKHGIDGIDGGSPLLFTPFSQIKSSRQIIYEFLLDSMHGEGDLLAHLVILGCKVNFQQPPLCEYDFKVKNIFEDLQDGVLLCRVVQLLQCNETILSKVVFPFDAPKKRLQNCSTAIQYLKDSGVQMSDSDGIMFTAADLANGDKELTCSILWNLFVHLQVPLLINRTSLLKEIAKIKGSSAELVQCDSLNEMNLLLHWIQAVCVIQNIEVHSFSSLNDGRALTCLIKFYFGSDIHQFLSEKENEDEYNDDRLRRLNCLSPAVHDIAFVQSVMAMLGNSSEVLHPCDIFDEDAYFDERSAMILLVFLASRLTNADKSDIVNSFRYSQQACQSPGVRRSSISELLHLQSDFPKSKNNLKELFCPPSNEAFGTCSSKEIILKIKRIQISWRGLMERRKYCHLKCAASILQAFIRCTLARRHILDSSARVIQAQFRGFIKRCHFLKIKNSTIFLQSVVKAWLTARLRGDLEYGTLACSVLPSTNGIYDRYHMFLIDRRRFQRTRKAVIFIQRFLRAWIRRKQINVKFMNPKMTASKTALENTLSYSCCHIVMPGYVSSLANIEKPSTLGEVNKTFELEWWAATKIQEGWKSFAHDMHSKRCSAIKIQSQWRCWLIRKNYLRQVKAIKIIQAAFLSLINRKLFQQKHVAAIEVQRFIRGHLARTKLLGGSNLRFSMLHRRTYAAIGDGFMYNFELRTLKNSIIKVQRWWKRLLLNRSRMHAAISIQSSVRGWIARKTAAKRKQNIFRIQGWWRKILYLKTRKTSALVIQAHVRGWIARQKAARNKHHIVLIQSCWKGYLVRKQSRPQLFNLRHRMKLSAANVNDEMRLINRLVVALSELLGYRSISNIRHTCATLDTATELSQKCCETLVDAGAVDILLKQIQLLNRGIPDQEVLKHVVSTLRNIVRYKHLSQVLINTPRSIELIFQQMLRNKNEGFLLSCQLLRRVCTTQQGLEAVRKLRGHVKRLNDVAVGLEREAQFLARNARQHHQRNLTARRLEEAFSLLSLIVDGYC